MQEEIFRKISIAHSKIDDLVATENEYVEDLKVIVEGYWGYMVLSKESELEPGIVPMPDDLKGGKDEIAVGWPNINKIYTLHKR